MANYEDRVLLSLKRKYSKDETVAALSKKLSETEVKNGVLLDELEELKDRIKNVNEIEKQNKQLRSQVSEHQKQISFLENEIKESRIYQSIKDSVDSVKKENQRLRLKVRELSRLKVVD